MSDTKTIVFNKICGIYMPGDRAGFVTNLAEHYIKRGFAHYPKGDEGKQQDPKVKNKVEAKETNFDGFGSEAAQVIADPVNEDESEETKKENKSKNIFRKSRVKK